MHKHTDFFALTGKKSLPCFLPIFASLLPYVTFEERARSGASTNLRSPVLHISLLSLAPRSRWLFIPFNILFYYSSASRFFILLSLQSRKPPRHTQNTLLCCKESWSILSLALPSDAWKTAKNRVGVSFSHLLSNIVLRNVSLNREIRLLLLWHALLSRRPSQLPPIGDPFRNAGEPTQGHCRSFWVLLIFKRLKLLGNRLFYSTVAHSPVKRQYPSITSIGLCLAF